MVKTPSKAVTLDEFLKRPETKPASEYDELQQQLPVPSFASELRLTVGELFGWLRE